VTEYSKLSKYSTLSDGELNRKIAETLGYRVESYFSGESGEDFFRLVSPGGYSDNHSPSLSEDTVWLNHLPDWTGNTDIAIGLASGLNWRGGLVGFRAVDLTKGDDPRYPNFVCSIPYDVVMEVEKLDMPHLATGWGDTLARAICEAWLLWHEYNEDGKETE
jgi:hypothetical protein